MGKQKLQPHTSTGTRHPIQGRSTLSQLPLPPSTPPISLSVTAAFSAPKRSPRQHAVVCARKRSPFVTELGSGGADHNHEGRSLVDEEP